MKIIKLICVGIILNIGISACSMPNARKSDSKSIVSGSSSNTPIQLNLEKYFSDIMKSESFVEHRVFDKVDSSDIIKISSQLVSTLTPKFLKAAESEYEGDKVYCTLNIFNGSKLVLIKDSVVSIGIYEFDSSSNKLTFPIYTSQNDDFANYSDLYLLDVESKNLIIVSQSVKNGVNVPFSAKKTSLLYINDNSLYKYDIKSKTSEILIVFTDDIYIQKIKVIDSRGLEVLYLKDLETKTLKRAIIKLDMDLFD